MEAGETYLVTRNGVEVAVVRAARTEQSGAAIVDFEPLPFEEEAATRYGTLVALTLAANRPADGPDDRHERSACFA